MKELIIYSDGSIMKNPGPGACACLLFRPGQKTKEFKRFLPHTTSNRAEMLGPLIILEKLEEAHRVTIYSDSMYLVNGLGKGLDKWKSRPKRWEHLPNKDLWLRYDSIRLFHDIKVCWIPSHSGHAPNEYVDNLAREVARKGYKKIKDNERLQKKIRKTNGSRRAQ